MAQIPDKSLKAVAAPADLVLIRDQSSNTDKRTTVAGLAAGIAPSIPPDSITQDQLDIETTGIIAMRVAGGSVDQGTPSSETSLSNALNNIKANLVAGFTYRIVYRTERFAIGGADLAEIWTREDTSGGNTLSICGATTPKGNVNGSLISEAFYTASTTGQKTFVFTLKLTGTGVTTSAGTRAYVECVGKPGAGV